MPTIVTATFRLDMNEPEDRQMIQEIRGHPDGHFRFNGQHFEATSVRSGKGRIVTVTAKPVEL